MAIQIQRKTPVARSWRSAWMRREPGVAGLLGTGRRRGSHVCAVRRNQASSPAKMAVAMANWRER